MMTALSCSGWLDKRGGQDASKEELRKNIEVHAASSPKGSLQGWKKRWCISKDNTLRYYKNDTSTVPAGTIFGEDIEEVAEEASDSQKDAKHIFVFKVVTKGRDYIFNANSSDSRKEWMVKVKLMVDSHRSEEVVDYSLRYATAEVYLNKGVRIHGEVGTVLSTQLTTPTSKTSTDEKGWFIDTPHSHAAILNLFTQHGWSLVTAFQCNIPLPGSNVVSQADTLVFSHPNS